MSICKFCGLESGRNGNHMFAHQCVRMLSVKKKESEESRALIREALAVLHSKTETLAGGIRYEGSGLSRKVLAAMAASAGKAWFERLSELEDWHDRYTRSTSAFLENLGDYCDRTKEFPEMLAEASGRIRNHIDIVMGRSGSRLNLSRIVSNEAKVEKAETMLLDIIPMMKTDPEQASRMAILLLNLLQEDRMKGKEDAG